jgi:hypothetical protein
MTLADLPPGFTLEFISVDRFLFRTSDLRDLMDMPPDLAQRLERSQIYLICRRPMLEAVSGTLNVSADIISFDVRYQVDGHHETKTVSIERRLLDSREVRFTLQSPSVIWSYDDSGNHISQTLISNYAHAWPLEAAARDLEVLYIGQGQAPGAVARLRRHPTLQRILGDTLSNDRSKEVFGVSFSFQMSAAHLPGGKLPSKTETEVFTRLLAELKRDRKKRLTLIEAAAIAYFQTEAYNVHYLNFPINNETRLRDFRRAKVASLIVHLDTTNIGAPRLYSSSVAPDSTHRIVVSL